MSVVLLVALGHRTGDQCRLKAGILSLSVGWLKVQTCCIRCDNVMMQSLSFTELIRRLFKKRSCAKDPKLS